MYVPKVRGGLIREARVDDLLTSPVSDTTALHKRQTLTLRFVSRLVGGKLFPASGQLRTMPKSDGRSHQFK